MNLKNQNLTDLLDDNDPLRFMRNDFIKELREYVAKKRTEINAFAFSAFPSD
jgi:hypothetical protein